jgi:cation transport regulator ChaC
MKYFAYGSNCNPAVMEKKGVQFTSRQHALLPGYRLLFNKKALRQRLPPDVGFANVNEDPDGTVEGVLYDIVDDHLALLDESERYPDHYTRIEITVQTKDAMVPCTTYQACPDKIADGLKPSRNYLNHILSAKDFLSWQYFEALDRSQTYHGDCACCLTTCEVVFIKEADSLHMLCQPCREARLVWGETLGRRLTVAETEAIMMQLVKGSSGFDSIQELVEEAITAKIITP